MCSVPNVLWCWLACDLFGKVQQGSPLSYQQPAKEKVQTLHNAPPPPSLPLQDYRLKPSECMFVFSRKQQLHMKSLEVSIECATRDQSECADWYNVRRPWVAASHFREICHVSKHWIGASPDGIIFDPLEQPQFGLVEMKCPNIRSYVDAPYLKVISGALQLKPTHAFYWQVQGQLLTAVMSWCDFVVSTQKYVFIQRIQRDEGLMETFLTLMS